MILYFFNKVDVFNVGLRKRALRNLDSFFFIVFLFT